MIEISCTVYPFMEFLSLSKIDGNLEAISITVCKRSGPQYGLLNFFHSKYMTTTVTQCGKFQYNMTPYACELLGIFSSIKYMYSLVT